MSRAEQVFLSIPNVVEVAGIGRSTVYREIEAGRLRVTKVGSRTLVHRDDLHAWADSLRGTDQEAT